MEALDNPSYFRLGGDAEELCLGGPRAVDMAPEERRWMRRSSDHERVVLGKTSATYYNMSQTVDHQRRHSFASSALQRTSSVTSKSSLDSENSLRRNIRAVTSGAGKSGMMDITILSSRESKVATDWVNYLTLCFHQISREQSKPQFKLAKVCVEDVLEGLPVEGSSGSRLQIVIVCPLFLDALTSSSGVPILASMLQPASVLAMLLGITPKALDAHPLSGLFRFEQWRKQQVKDQDATIVGDFLGVAMDVLSRSWQLQQAIAQMKVDNNRANFSIVPKKIKVGQNKLSIFLNDPISTNDKITINVEKSGTKIEVQSIKRRNPYTLQFAMPSSCLQTSVLVAVNVERNGRSLGNKLVKCESRLRELEQLLKSADNPLVFMCQALGLTSGDKDQLDSFLVGSFQKNMPPNFHLLNSATRREMASSEEYPTLLHFAARYGLEKLCWQLLECPGGEVACQLKNANQQTPSELADKSGHPKLANALQGYLQMTELSSMYSYLKGVSEKQDEKNFEDGNYLMPRPLNDTYLIPPKARPVLPNLTLENYNVPPSPKDLFLSSPKDFHMPKMPKEYYQMPPSPKEVFSVPQSPLENYQSPPTARPFTPLTPTTPTSPLESKFAAYLQMHSRSPGHFDQIIGPEKKYTSCHTDNISISSGHHYINTSSAASTSSKSPEDELVEIINDFKNNVFTIGEVEKLVDAWRNRNDVQQSFREKQEQLNRMREEYDRIQQKMKDQMKRATPFERIKKFFSRKAKHDGCKARNPGDPNSPHRPVSSLSLHSSCSSSSCGRMSTSSGTSLGDSGTHSDPDEKKSELMNADKIVPCNDIVFHEKLASVKENEMSSYGDDYVCACPSVQIAKKLPLPKPPSSACQTVVEVHRSAECIREEIEESEKKLETSEEMRYLEQSERLLKDMAKTLPNYEDDDVLSPPESAFLQGEDFNEIKVIENEESMENSSDFTDIQVEVTEKSEQTESKMQNDFEETIKTEEPIKIEDFKILNSYQEVQTEMAASVNEQKEIELIENQFDSQKLNSQESIHLETEIEERTKLDETEDIKSQVEEQPETENSTEEILAQEANLESQNGIKPTEKSDEPSITEVSDFSKDFEVKAPKEESVEPSKTEVSDLTKEFEAKKPEEVVENEEFEADKLKEEITIQLKEVKCPGIEPEKDGLNNEEDRSREEEAEKTKEEVKEQKFVSEEVVKRKIKNEKLELEKSTLNENKKIGSHVVVQIGEWKSEKKHDESSSEKLTAKELIKQFTVNQSTTKEELQTKKRVTKEIDGTYVNVNHTATTKELYSIENAHTQSYVNISFPSPPPLPSKIKYKNLLL